MAVATKRELVGLAFAEIGLGTWEFDLQPEEIGNAISRMDSLLAQWSAKGIRLGYNASSDDPDADSGLPDVAQEAVLLNVARIIAPGFGKTLNPASLVAARQAYDDLLTRFTAIPQRQYPGTLPYGAGNRNVRAASGYGYFYPPPVETIDAGEDSPIEFIP